MDGHALCCCHSEGATRSGLISEEKNFPMMQIETTASEESQVTSRHC